MLFDTVEFLSESSTIVNPVVSGELKQTETAPTSSTSTITRQYVDDSLLPIQVGLAEAQAQLESTASLDLAQTFAEPQTFNSLVADGFVQEQVTATTLAATYTFDLTEGPIFDLTMGQNCTFTMPAAAPGLQFTVFLSQDQTGNRVPTFPATVKFPASTPAWTLTANGTDVVSFISIRNIWVAFIGGINYNLA